VKKTDFKMEKDKPRLARLTAILTQLQSKRVVSAREIAEKHDVSIRTIYRDIRILEQSGIPIFTQEGKGYSIVENYKLPPVMFTEKEAHALITAEQMISRNKDASLAKEYGKAIEKIKAILNYSQKDKVNLLADRLQIRINQGSEHTSNHLIEIQQAITNYQVLEIEYLSLKQELSKREIEPYALVHTNENWILIAHCRLRNDFRAFRLDCIRSLKALQNSFEPHEISLQKYFDSFFEK
jgi:predicted DNA-binding transcriptional regulator YafY